MGWLQGAIWSNPHVKEAITAMKQKREASYPDLTPLQGFKEFG
jgi:enoyl-CoA hydratase